jgi:hypothetical protein
MGLPDRRPGTTGRQPGPAGCCPHDLARAPRQYSGPRRVFPTAREWGAGPARRRAGAGRCRTARDPFPACGIDCPGFGTIPDTSGGGPGATVRPDEAALRRRRNGRRSHQADRLLGDAHQLPPSTRRRPRSSRSSASRQRRDARPGLAVTRSAAARWLVALDDRAACIRWDHYAPRCAWRSGVQRRPALEALTRPSSTGTTSEIPSSVNTAAHPAASPSTCGRTPLPGCTSRPLQTRAISCLVVP